MTIIETGHRWAARSSDDIDMATCERPCASAAAPFVAFLAEHAAQARALPPLASSKTQHDDTMPSHRAPSLRRPTLNHRLTPAIAMIGRHAIIVSHD